MDTLDHFLTMTYFGVYLSGKPYAPLCFLCIAIFGLFNIKNLKVKPKLIIQGVTSARGLSLHDFDLCAP